MENILEKINRAGLTLLEINPEETYSAVVNEAIRLVDAEYGSILLGKNDNLTCVYASDPFLSELKTKKRGTIMTAFTKNMLIINHVTKATKVNPIIRRKGIQSVILIPLAYQKETIGVLTILSLKKEHFTQKQVDMLRIFGSMASFAIKKSQLYNDTKKALEIRDMFISMAAHELRTPLTSISGYIQLLHSKLAGRSGPEGKWIEALYEENRRMMHLVKSILEVNRLRAGQMQFRWQECDIDTIIHESVNNISSRFTDRKIHYKNSLKVKATIVGDSERLIQVFDNIIDNAFKYSRQESIVDISLFGRANYVVASIQDYGKGIDKKDLPMIFDGQHRGDGGEEGFGLGLLFVENIIRQHRGLISVKSKLKQGTKVEVRLPKAKYRRQILKRKNYSLIT